MEMLPKKSEAAGKGCGISKATLKRVEDTDEDGELLPLPTERHRKQYYKSAGLCRSCRKITITTLNQFSRTYWGLVQSASECSFCSLVLGSLRRSNPLVDPKLKEFESFRRSLRYDENGISDYSERPLLRKRSRFREDAISLSLRQSEILIHASVSTGNLRSDTSFEATSTVMLFVASGDKIDTDQATETASIHLQIPADPRPKGEDKYKLMEKWLSEDFLLKDSSTDLGIETPEIQPNRIIYLGTSSDSQGWRLRLLKTKSVGMTLGQDKTLSKLGYVTLSHRWGSSRHFITTKATLKARQDGFLLEDLPQTYRDAAIVTLRLGFHFLWIDALCIVQDDEEEWLKESVKMGDIYKFARFTIASHCSRDDQEGFLALALRRRGSVRLGAKSQPFFARAAAHFDTDVVNSPLCKRGWVLQERFLSTRILHFTYGMIYWETIHGAESEDGPIQDSSSTLASLDLSSFSKYNSQDIVEYLDSAQSSSPALSYTTSMTWLISGREFSELGNASMEKISSWTSPSPLEWFHLVKMYSDCDLTQEGDKLIAIAGMAMQIHKRTNVPYLAGLWADRLCPGILWLYRGHALRQPTQQRAPSWSWAALDGPIQFPLEAAGISRDFRFVSVTGPADGAEEDASTTWLNGPATLTLKTRVLDISGLISGGEVFVGRYEEKIDPGLPNSAMERDKEPLWKPSLNPQIKFDQDTRARRLDSLQSPWDRLIKPPKPPPGFGSWVVFDDRAENIFGDSKIWMECDNYSRRPGFCYASIAYNAPHFSSRDPEPNGFSIGLFLIPTGNRPNEYRRVGMGIIKTNFLAHHGVQMQTRVIALV